MKVLEERSKNESSLDALLHHLIPLYNSVESVENVLFGQSSVNPPGENYAIVGDSSVNLDEVQFIIEEPSKKTSGPLMTSARKTQKVSRPPDPIQSGENMTPNTEARPVPGRTNSFNIIKRTNFNCDNCTRNMIEKGKGVTEFVNMNAK